MKTAGIICEYNPLHGGHLRQIQTLKKQGFTHVLCVMSASFVQRGEPAIYDKFCRAKWALLAGADCVLELPCISSLQNAEGFAQGAISILDACGCVEGFCFGSETENLDALQSVAELHLERPQEFSTALREQLAEGRSYPYAMQAAAQACLPKIDPTVFSPNATLGIEYIKAAIRLGSHMQPIPVLRDRKSDPISSSLCREKILGGALPDMLPDFVKKDLPNLRPVSLDMLFEPIALRLLQLRPEGISELPDVTEGLENRIYSAISQSHCLEDFYHMVSTKRYPLARIKRILCCAMLGITQADVLQSRKTGPQYARPLAVRNSNFLSMLNASCQIPLMTKPIEYRDDPSFQTECFATDLHAHLAGAPIGKDFTAGILKLA